MTYLREHRDGTVLVHAARAVHAPPDIAGFGAEELLYGAMEPTATRGLSPEPGVTILQLEPKA